MTHVRPAQKADIGELSRTLARAFFDDPVTVWILNDPARRPTSLRRFFAAMTRHHHLAGGGVEVAGDGGQIVAAALWSPPGRWQTSRLEELRMLPGLIRAFGPEGRRGRILEALMRQHHPPEEPHWYLATIGSDPAVRGQGYGHALMTSRLDRVDAACAPAYLESSKPENVPYYQRFGFQVTGEIQVPDGGPTLWSMWRAPR